MLASKISKQILSRFYSARTASSASSALLVSGRKAQEHFAVFSPELDFDWIKGKIKTAQQICKVKGVDLDVIDTLINWDCYKQLKNKEKSIVQLVTGLDEKINSIKADASKESERLQLVDERKSIKKELKPIKEAIWDIEESDILALLNFQNFNEQTSFADKVVHTFGEEKTFSFSPKSHISLGKDLNLLEFSENSHTSFYLKGQLALLELKIGQFFKNQLLSCGFEIMSNPDFTKTVMAEGCGRTIKDSNQTFSLKASQDFGDVSSLNAMHLVGGSSIEPFAAFWSRQILNNPQILPINAFCIGRQYRPQNSDQVEGLFKTQQATAVEMFSVSSSEEEMNEQLEVMRDVMERMYQVMGTFRVVEVGVAGLDRSDCRGWSYQVKSAGTGEWVEAGRLREQGEYFSKRMMMKQKVEGGVANMWTLGGTAVNVTRIVGLLVEMYQDEQGGVGFDQLFKLFDD